jgi:pilus assembly protein FimV
MEGAMNNKKTPISRVVPLVMTSALCLPNLGWALGLGKLVVNSALDEPLNAEVHLLSVGSIPLNNVVVSLATPEQFKLAGIDKPYILSQLKFQVVRNRRNRPVIHISTKGRVDTPYLKFLMDVRWPEGEFFRAYTVLLDPATYTQGRSIKRGAYHPSHVPTLTLPSAVPLRSEPKRLVPQHRKPQHPKPPTREEQQQKGAAAKAEPATAKPAEQTSSTTPATQAKPVSKRTYFGPVESNQTLSVIAKKVRPNNSVTIDQTMMAIQKDNPNAFAHHNIDNLKAGVSLSLPTLQEIKAISKNWAREQVQSQEKDWRQAHTKSKAAPTPSPANMIKPATQNKPTGVESSPLISGINNKKGGTQTTALKAELAISAEAVNSVKQANVTLSQELVSLREQNQQLQNKLTQQATQLASLEKTVSQNSQSARQQHWQAVNATQVNGFGNDEATLENSTKGFWDNFILILLSCAGLGGAAYYFRRSGSFSFALDDAMPFRADASASSTDEAPSSPAHNPHDTPVKTMLKTGRVEDARAYLENALKQTPEDIDLQLLYLETLSQAGDHATFSTTKARLFALVQNTPALNEQVHVQVEQIERQFQSQAASPAQTRLDVPTDPSMASTAPDTSINDSPASAAQAADMSAPVDETPAPAADTPATDEQSLEFESVSMDSFSPVRHDHVVPEAASNDDSEENVEVKMDLAVAYFDMGDVAEAKRLLTEVIADGHPDCQTQAQALLQKIETKE